jgi:Flp pilus assembly protein TadG
MERELIKRKKRGFLWRDESGQVLVLVALGAVFLIGMVALVVDIGHGLVVRNELQNAADASSLAGAGKLFDPSPGPNWSVAKNAASSSIAWNRSDGQSLVNCTADYGVWNRSNNPAVFQLGSTTIDTTHDPAVMVQVSRADGQNGGPVSTWFARIFGNNKPFISFDVNAQAVAAVSHPGNALPGTLIPIAIGDSMFDGTKLLGRNKFGPGNPITISSAYHAVPGITEIPGQWTSFVDPSNSANPQTLIQNLTPIIIGDPNTGKIYIQPGTKTANYKPLEAFIGKDVCVPVINVAPNILVDKNAAKNSFPVVGFSGFHILSVVGKDDKQMTGYFLDGFTCSGTGGSGPNYGAWTPPHLVL